MTENTKIQVGGSASITRAFTSQDVVDFAEISGDKNPIHLDDEYAAQSRFKRRIVHGALTSALISAVLGQIHPGPGTIYLSQTLIFKRPVFIGDELTARVEVVALDEAEGVATFSTIVTNQKAKSVLEGEAVVIVPEKVD